MSVLGDTVMLSATLPRLEGELVMAAIDALADRLRTQADHVPAAARRADALVELVNAAGAAGALPSRGGLPVALTVTMDTTTAGDTIWTTSRGHLLTRAEQRFTACHAQITPVQLTPTTCPHTPTDTTTTGATTSGATVRCTKVLGQVISYREDGVHVAAASEVQSPVQGRGCAAGSGNEAADR
jgi:hypothetical protein